MVAQLKFYFIPGVMVAALGSAAPALASDTYPPDVLDKAERLGPTSSWGLDYAQDGCRLARTFGTDRDQHLLYIEQAWPSAAFTMTIAGRTFKRFRRGGRAYLGLQNDVPITRFEIPPVGNLGQFGPAVILASVEVGSGGNTAAPRLRVGSENEIDIPGLVSAQLDPAEGAKIGRLIIYRSGGKPVSLETGNLKVAFEALNTCTADLMKEWGLDPAKHVSYTPAKWLNQDAVVRQIQRRYPAAALNRGEQAIFRMRVIIDEEGEVTDCDISAATTADSLASPACTEMSKAQFTPASDADGNPMRSFYASTITYQIGN